MDDKDETLQNLDMMSIVPDSVDEGRVQPINPFTHELNFDNINDINDVVEVLKSLKISIDPNQWEQSSKYIKLK